MFGWQRKSRCGNVVLKVFGGSGSYFYIFINLSFLLVNVFGVKDIFFGVQRKSRRGLKKLVVGVIINFTFLSTYFSYWLMFLGLNIYFWCLALSLMKAWLLLSRRWQWWEKDDILFPILGELQVTANISKSGPKKKKKREWNLTRTHTHTHIHVRTHTIIQY